LDCRVIAEGEKIVELWPWKSVSLRVGDGLLTCRGRVAEYCK
jgi:hypothetical protein